MARIKKNDTVLVLSGKDRGRRAKVLQVMPGEDKLLVEGVNVVKKHTKPRPPKVPQGGIMEKAMPIHVSKVMLVCPSCSTPTRSRMKVGDAGKERICSRCKESI